LKNQYRLELNLDHDELAGLVDRLRDIVQDPDRSPDEKKRFRRLIKVLKELRWLNYREVSPKMPISKRFGADHPPWLTG